MINEYNTKQYCSEDIALIENYQQSRTRRKCGTSITDKNVMKMKILSFLLIGILQFIVVRDWQGRNVIVDVSRGQHVQPHNIGMYMSNSHVPGHARQKPRTKKKTLRLGHCEKPSLSKGGAKKLRLSR